MYGDIFSDILEEMDPLDTKDDEVEFLTLNDAAIPTHYRCSSHTLARIGSSDSKAAENNNSYQQRFEGVFEKLNKLWSATHRPKSSEIIKSILKSSLILPCKTRWNSLEDGIEKVLEFDLQTLNDVMVALELPKFTADDYLFLQEYQKVTQPIAKAIDNLQATNCYYAIWLPTLHTLRAELLVLEKENLKFCRPLLKAIHDGYNKRFAQFFETRNAKYASATIAACTHPYFKTRWREDQTPDGIEFIQDILVSAAINMCESDLYERSITIDPPESNGMSFF